jgi:hypothetical protein
VSSEYWLVVEGTGSFSLGKDAPTWRGRNRLTVDQAERVLVYLDAHPSTTHIRLTLEEPDPDPDEQPDQPGPVMLRLSDLRPASSEPRTSPEAPTPDADAEDESLEDESHICCTACDVELPNHARLVWHYALRHGDANVVHLDAVRQQIARDRAQARRTARASEAEAQNLHPAERLPLELPTRPSLWPQMPPTI